MKILCVLYDDPKDGMPTSYPVRNLPELEKVVFGGAMLVVFLAFGTVVVSLCIFLYKWATSSSK